MVGSNNQLRFLNILYRQYLVFSWVNHRSRQDFILMPAVDFDNVAVGNSQHIKELLFVLIQQALDRERIISEIIQNKTLIEISKNIFCDISVHLAGTRHKKRFLGGVSCNIHRAANHRAEIVYIFFIGSLCLITRKHQ